MRTLWFFKPVIDFPEYLLCSDGTVYNKEGHVMSIIPSRQGYPRIQFKSKGRRVLKSVRFLVLSHFKKKINPYTFEDSPF